VQAQASCLLYWYKRANTDAELPEPATQHVS
jgi:hypothetical protein